MPRVVIIGGGISGLATAFHLQSRLPTADVTVLEASSRPGGTIWTERRDGFQLEIGANGFLDTKPSTLRLCEKLGIADQLIPANDAARHRFLFLNNRLQPLPESLWSFIRSPILSWRAKLALVTERFRKPRRDDGDESFHDFVTRRTNEEVADTLGDAIVSGIHAADPKLLSAMAAFPRVTEWEREFGSMTAGMSRAAKARKALGKAASSGSRLLSFRTGLRFLMERLSESLRSPPIHGVAVRRIELDETGWKATADGRDSWTADAVVLACPDYQQAGIVADLDTELAEAMNAIPYAPAVVVGLGYRRADVPHELNGFGFITPQRLRRDILGAQWCSSIFPDRAPPGMVLIRAIAGGWNRSDIADWNDQRLLDAVRQEFQATMGIQAAPVFQHIARWTKAIPQYHLGHLERVARIDQRVAMHPGLFVTGNAYKGVAMNDCTEQAEIIAERVSDYIDAITGSHL